MEAHRWDKLPLCGLLWRNPVESRFLRGHTLTVNPTDLIAGPYKPPTLRKGERTFCLYRDAEVVITSWSDARIPWPRARSVHYK
jgi:hypothetical protein